MTDVHSGHLPGARQFDRWTTAVASLIVGTAFFSMWFWLLPQWLGFQVQMTGVSRWRWLAALPSVLGFAIALRCIWDLGDPVAIVAVAAVALGCICSWFFMRNRPCARNLVRTTKN